MPISSEPEQTVKLFYHYTGFHSLLIGLFPFYIPVFLWKLGFTLAEISYFIACTGFGFCATLWLWDRISKRVGLRTIITASFLLEAALLSGVYLSGSIWFLPLFALLNGAYNCFFWIVQRVLFYKMVSPGNSGRNFGNFQIFVVIILKIGVFTGAILLEKHGFLALYLLSVLTALLGTISLRFFQVDIRLPATLLDERPLSLTDLWDFKDGLRSKLIFSFDGVFLFLESYFWLISLFLLVRESFWHLGLLVIVLTITFSLLFLFIKNTIDHIAKQKIYVLAVVLYIGAWLLRGGVEGVEMASSMLFTVLVLITFCTSFFRLAFNKRFFDHAKRTSGYNYIMAKSYYSQFYIGVTFMALGLIYSHWPQVSPSLCYAYIAAAFAALLYLSYPLPES
ncbi:MAG: MFS transporter [Thermodesulfobacteriota bacterium]